MCVSGAIVLIWTETIKYMLHILFFFNFDGHVPNRRGMNDFTEALGAV